MQGGWWVERVWVGSAGMCAPALLLQPSDATATKMNAEFAAAVASTHENCRHTCGTATAPACQHTSLLVEHAALTKRGETGRAVDAAAWDVDSHVCRAAGGEVEGQR